MTQFLYDGDELVAEYDGWGTLLRRYVHGDGSDDPLFWYEGSGFDQPRFPHTDRQGSITATAGPGAALLSINTYDEYGIPGANNVGRFQYTGQAWLPELGLYYYKARIYSPTLGRFLQVDPIGYDDQINLYVYVANDPVSAVDPTGLSGCADMKEQGLSGSCDDSSNFREQDTFKKNGKLDHANNRFGRDAVGSSATDGRATQFANDTNQAFGNETAHRMDITGSGVSLEGIAMTSATPTSGAFPVSAIAGAEAMIHPHPTEHNTIVPGPSDWQAPARGVPNYVAHGKRVIVTEISGGQVRIRVVGGSVTKTERQELRRRANEYQRIGKGSKW